MNYCSDRSFYLQFNFRKYNTYTATTSDKFCSQTESMLFFPVFVFVDFVQAEIYSTPVFFLLCYIQSCEKSTYMTMLLFEYLFPQNKAATMFQIFSVMSFLYLHFEFAHNWRKILILYNKIKKRLKKTCYEEEIM